MSTFSKVNHEHWRDIPGYEHLYQVSDLGRIKRLPRIVAKRGTNGYRVSERILSPTPNKKGYLRTTLRIGKEIKSYLVHRLVLLAFVGPCPVGKETCHGDGNSANNVLSNLRYDTKEANEGDKKTHGTDNSGSRQWQSVLNEEKVLEIRTKFFDANGIDQKDLAEEYGVHQTTIHEVLSRKNWRHVGGPDCSAILKQRYSESKYKSKITRHDEGEMVSMRREGWPQQDIANKFGVSAVTVSRVLKRHGLKRIRCNRPPQG